MRLAVAAVVLGMGIAQDASPAISVRAAARTIRPGELVVLTITTAVAADVVHARGLGREWLPFKIDPRTWRVLIGIDLDTRPGRYSIAVEANSGGGAVRATHSLVVVARSFPTRRLTVEQAFVNPPASALPRIEEDARRLAACWSGSASQRLWSAPFVPPVPQPANSAFGTRSIYNGQARRPHNGADFPSPAGTPIAAPNAGRVLLARNLYFTGNSIVIDHGLGLFSMLAHLSVIEVEEGATVTAGQQVGRVGATGRVTGPHLHWSIRAGGARVDPLSLLALLGT